MREHWYTTPCLHANQHSNTNVTKFWQNIHCYAFSIPVCLFFENPLLKKSVMEIIWAINSQFVIWGKKVVLNFKHKSTMPSDFPQGFDNFAFGETKTRCNQLEISTLDMAQRSEQWAVKSSVVSFSVRGRHYCPRHMENRSSWRFPISWGRCVQKSPTTALILWLNNNTRPRIEINSQRRQPHANEYAIVLQIQKARGCRQLPLKISEK